MGTLVTIHVVGEDELSGCREAEQSVERAFGWFHRVEQCCTRFDPDSEIMQLTRHAGEAVPVSTILYEAVQFALAIAQASGGAFDPTVGYAMETRGFNRNYVTGLAIRTAVDSTAGVSYRDVHLAPDRQTVTLLRPLILDLGAVAKGLAVDLAARELQPFENFAINAGGDLYLGGKNPDAERWLIGIRHPQRNDELIDSLRISNLAVCTSGDYERRGAHDREEHHILDPRTASSANVAASVTVIASNAMLADALATAAFVLGPVEGIQLLERYGVDGLILSSKLERFATRGLCAYY
jgi:thiamine biosynthesis lipoprotein